MFDTKLQLKRFSTDGTYAIEDAGPDGYYFQVGDVDWQNCGTWYSTPMGWDPPYVLGDDICVVDCSDGFELYMSGVKYLDDLHHVLLLTNLVASGQPSTGQVDQQLSELIDGLDTRLSTVEDSMDTEVTTPTANAIADAVSVETSARVASIALLTTAISDVEQTCNTAALDGRVSAIEDSMATQVTTPVTDAINGAIAAEATARIDADSQQSSAIGGLDTRLSTVEESMATEVPTPTANAISDAVGAETAARVEAINAEASARTEAVLTLEGAIAASEVGQTGVAASLATVISKVLTIETQVVEAERETRLGQNYTPRV